MYHSRRRFLGGLASLWLGLPKSASATEKSVRMPTRTLGRTGLRVSILEVGGTYRFTPRFVRRALDLRCNFFDTAASYANGWSERTLGEAIRKLDARKDVVIVTKGHPKHPGGLEAAIDESLGRLGFDYVDVYYLHNLDEVAVLSDPDWRKAADAMKRKGKIRFFGFSCHNPHVVPLLTDAARAGFIDVIMLKYNFRTYGDAELNKALDAAHRANIGLIAMKTQGSAVSFSERVNPFQEQGYSKHQAVLKAVWKDERLAAAISAMPSISVLEQNAAAASEKLSAAEESLLREYADRTAADYCHGGCGGCQRECEISTGGRLAIADTLRYLMYHDSYGRRADARAKYAALPLHRKQWIAMELEQAERACPRALPLRQLLRRAATVLGT
ncbi:MAG: aldo/keto reductase [Phycisphaerae bacterium]|nr:aldo/keto reductase [Phycisphaerae bacterium]